MYVLLTQDVPQVGTKNSLVTVSDGYFMNYLAPQGLAKAATESMINSLQDEILIQKDSAAHAAKEEVKQANTLKGAEVVFTAEASDKGTLFKALNQKDVVKAINDTFGITLDPSMLIMDHLKKVGDHSIAVNFGEEQVEMKVVVNAA